ncbi:MAG: hypothetical protein HQK50_05795 [Oligoflexia bacterium]|nr:hypothetical protein [Oligoflexia bacterium]MBF0365063.1 hypothetical protein [Oligoflexia bacterium]
MIPINLLSALLSFILALLSLRGALLFESKILQHKAYFFKYHQSHRVSCLSRLQEGSKQLLALINHLISCDNGSAFTPLPSSLPQYKFYTELLVKILNHRQTLGSLMRESLRSLKDGLIEDTRFEKSLQGLELSSNLQFLFIALMSWIFILLFARSTKTMMPEPLLTPSLTLLLLFWQGGGYLLYLKLQSHIKQKLFAPFSHYFYLFYNFRAMERANFSWAHITSELQEEIAMLTQKEQANSDFTNSRDRLYQIMELGQVVGGELTRLLDEAIDDLWFLQKERFRRFMGSCKVLKMLITTIFFILPYFYFLFKLFSHFTKW